MLSTYSRVESCLAGYYCNEDEELTERNGKLICYDCWENHMCQQCFYRNTIQTRELEGLAKCNYCEKIISVECKCMAITWCQCFNCVCKKCLSEDNRLYEELYYCWKCKKVINDEMITPEKYIIVGDCSDEIFCNKCKI